MVKYWKLIELLAWTIIYLRKCDKNIMSIIAKLNNMLFYIEFKLNIHRIFTSSRI